MAFSCCKLEIFDLWKSLSESSDKAPHSLSLVYDELASLTSLFLPHNFFDQHEILTVKSSCWLIKNFDDEFLLF